MRRLLSLSVVALVLGFLATPVASAQQTVNFFIGGFVPHSLDARSGDVLYQDSTGYYSLSTDPAGFDMSAFHGVTVGGEYLVGLTRNFEAGLGLGFYQRSVDTFYTNVVNSDGTDITQTLKLRIVPFTATVRWLPFGNHNPVQPYVGAGVGVLIWRYSETGQFVDSSNNIFNANSVGSGAKTGPVVLGGVKLASGPAAFGFEIRWQDAKADLPADQGFVGSTIDLGGFNYLFTVGFRF
jgi:outer membrane protein W